MRESESVFLKCRLQSRSRHFENADSGVGSRSRHFQNADSGVESRSRHFKKADSGVESRSRHFSKCRLRSRESESAFFKMPTPESGVGVGLNSSDSPALTITLFHHNCAALLFFLQLAKVADSWTRRVTVSAFCNCSIPEEVE